MLFDLIKLKEHCSELDIDASLVSEVELEVSLNPDVVLGFVNLAEESDNLIGFKGTPWHCHDSLTLVVDDAFLEFSACEIMSALKVGDLLIIDQLIDGKLKDRWIAHKREPFDVEYIESGEEIRIHRLY